MKTAEQYFRDNEVQSSIDENGNYCMYTIIDMMEGFAQQEIEKAVMEFKERFKIELDYVERLIREDLILRERLNEGERDFIQLIREGAIPKYYFELENAIEKLK